MRELSFVKKIKFNFPGSVFKRALLIGDADNDEHNELVCANLQGELAIFKELSCNKFAYATKLGMITACSIGDSMNLGRNFVVAINVEGWLFIFDVTPTPKPESNDKLNIDEPKKLSVFYEQRMPANCKEILLADLDGDGKNELIIGLTDRVLRTYKWINVENGRGKFVGLYKWEFADQIGSVSLNPSERKNCMDIIVAQPGGTYARLECFDKKPVFTSHASTSNEDRITNDCDKIRSNSKSSEDQADGRPPLVLENPNNEGDDGVKTEYINKLTPEYHQLVITQMRNPHISTEVLGGIKDGKGLSTYYSLVIATLDGTLMLVSKDEILWSLQVDHQLFALAVIEQMRKDDNIQSSCLPSSESTCTIVPTTVESNDQISTSVEAGSPTSSNSHDRSLLCQYFVVCAWNGKTYIVDEERNYLRFKFDEAVSAFTAGSYYFEGEHHSALVYATFNNQIVLYYDVVSEDIRPKFLLDEIMNNPEHIDLLEKLELLSDKLDLNYHNDATASQSSSKTQKFYRLIHDVLYGFTDDELSQ